MKRDMMAIHDARRSGGNLMLHDSPEAAWPWPNGKVAAAAASDSGFGSSQDARVPASGGVSGATDPDVIEVAFRNDVRPLLQ